MATVNPKSIRTRKLHIPTRLTAKYAGVKRNDLSKQEYQKGLEEVLAAAKVLNSYVDTAFDFLEGSRGNPYADALNAASKPVLVNLLTILRNGSGSYEALERVCTNGLEILKGVQ